MRAAQRQRRRHPQIPGARRSRPGVLDSRVIGVRKQGIKRGSQAFCEIALLPVYYFPKTFVGVLGAAAAAVHGLKLACQTVQSSHIYCRVF